MSEKMFTAFEKLGIFFGFLRSAWKEKKLDPDYCMKLLSEDEDLARQLADGLANMLTVSIGDHMHIASIDSGLARHYYQGSVQQELLQGCTFGGLRDESIMQSTAGGLRRPITFLNLLRLGSSPQHHTARKLINRWICEQHDGHDWHLADITQLTVFNALVKRGDISHPGSPVASLWCTQDVSFYVWQDVDNYRFETNTTSHEGCAYLIFS